MPKYITVKVSGIITQIAKETEIEGYTEGVMEIFFPDDKELEEWDEHQHTEWVTLNNQRMEAICSFLNKHDY